MIQKLGGRKFLVTLAVMVVGIVIDLFTQKGLSDNVMYLLMAASTGFGVVNVGKYAIERKAQAQAVPPADPVDLGPVLDAVSGHTSTVVDAVNSLKPKRGRKSTTQVDFSPIFSKIEDLEGKIKAENADALKELMNYVKAIQNQGVVMSDLLKQSSQLQVQTYQVLTGLIQGPQKS